MDVSIIIVNYKTANLIKDCICSIVKYTMDIEYEIIVVDNNSHDDCKIMLATHFDNIDCKFIGLNDNLGFGRANNEGFKIAEGRNVLCLNPDTILLNNAIKMMCDFLDDHIDVGACGGNLLDEDMKPTLSYRISLPSILWEVNILSCLKLERLIWSKCCKYNYKDYPIEVGYITGADLMIKKDVIDKTFGFSPDFFMYYEETDLCRRIKRMGYKIYNIPNAKIQHLEGKSFRSCGKKKKNKIGLAFSEQSRLTYYRRNHSRLHTTFANLVYMIALLQNRLLFRILGNEVWKDYDYRIKVFKSLIK